MIPDNKLDFSSESLYEYNFFLCNPYEVNTYICSLKSIATVKLTVILKGYRVYCKIPRQTVFVHL